MSNESSNRAEINRYREELKAMLGDIRGIDAKVLTRSVNAGLRDVKRNTPVKTGYLRRNWQATPIRGTAGGVEQSLENPVEYGLYVNDGHRVVNRAGETVGFVEGKFFLEHAVRVVGRAMAAEFRREVERVRRKYGP